jgi:hypothetical protein
MRNHFVVPGHRKKLLGLNHLSDVLCRRMGLRIHNLPSGRLKKLFWRSRISVASSYRYAMHFLNPGSPKKRLGRYCLSDFLRRGMDLKTHNLPSGSL